MLVCATGFSQIPDPPPLPPPNPGLPIDGGLSFLLILGVAYGIYELRMKKR